MHMRNLKELCPTQETLSGGVILMFWSLKTLPHEPLFEASVKDVKPKTFILLTFVSSGGGDCVHPHS